MQDEPLRKCAAATPRQPPEFQLRLGQTPDAVAVVQSFFEECRREGDAQARARLIERLEDTDPAEKTLLQLFGTPGSTAPGEPQHPWLESTVYNAIQELERAGVLTRVRIPTKRHGTTQRYTDSIALAPAAVELVGQLILGHPAARTEITLDLSQIASSVERGSGTRA